MGIGPIPNIPAMPAKVSSAAPADLPSTRAVAYYPHQQEESSYTPSGQSQQAPDQQEQSEPNQETSQPEAAEQDFMQQHSFSLEVIETEKPEPAAPPVDSADESTISFFA